MSFFCSLWPLTEIAYDGRKNWINCNAKPWWVVGDTLFVPMMSLPGYNANKIVFTSSFHLTILVPLPRLQRAVESFSRNLAKHTHCSLVTVHIIPLICWMFNCHSIHKKIESKSAIWAGARLQIHWSEIIFDKYFSDIISLQRKCLFAIGQKF